MTTFGENIRLEKFQPYVLVWTELLTKTFPQASLLYILIWAVEPDFKKSIKSLRPKAPIGACIQLFDGYYPLDSPYPCSHFEMRLTSVGLFVQEL